MLRTALLLGVTLLAGCAGVTTLSEPPQVNLVALAPEDFQLFEQRYRVTIRVLNPNDTELRIRGLSYAIYLNDELFGNGVNGDYVVVPPFGDRTMTVTVVSNLARIIAQLRQLTGDPDEKLTFRYGIKGAIALEGVLGKIPFEHEGEIDLSGTAAAPAGKAI